MDPSRRWAPALAALLATTLLVGCFGGEVEGAVRLGYFPNLTHAQALYGIETGMFQDSLGETELRVVDFNAGPAAMEALLTRHIDVTYVGPSPTLNTLANTGDLVRIIAGTASGGARFIIQPGLDLSTNASIKDRVFASPQLGNTQDVSLKEWLRDHGHRTKDRGGDVQVLNPPNAEILTLFQRGDIDGAWVPEPWATRLERDAGGIELVDEADLWPEGRFVTTHLVSTRSYIERHPDVIRALVSAHVNATLAVQQGGDEVLAAINDGIESATGQRLADGLLAAAFPRVNFTYDPHADTFYEFAAMAKRLGFLHKTIDSDNGVYSLDHLQAVLAQRGLAPVEAGA